MEKMPVVFVGHGSPLNAIEHNSFTRNWLEMAQHIPRPKAILAISAHWFTAGTRINDAAQPETVYDMYGFPPALYEVEYPVPGAPEIARLTQNLLGGRARIDNSWGIDHGTWSVLTHMYPAADIPLFQMSIDSQASPETHFALGRQLSSLRETGVLLFTSGNVVHNLAKVDWEMDGGYPYADDFDQYIRDKILTSDYADVVDYHQAGPSAQLAFFTPEHFYPLLYALGAAGTGARPAVYNDRRVMGSLSMTSYLFT